MNNPELQQKITKLISEQDISIKELEKVIRICSGKTLSMGDVISIASMSGRIVLRRDEIVTLKYVLNK